MTSLSTISRNLHTQDSRITANPIFIVQQKRRVGGFEEGYAYDYAWVSNDDSEPVDAAMAKALDAAEVNAEDDFPDPEDPDIQRDVSDYRKVFYRDEWVFVQPFFTEQGAKDYIAINGHNLREPRIYVESGYRNDEWRILREHLMSLTQPPL